MSMKSLSTLTVVSEFGSPNWHPFTLRDEQSVDALNALFENGWILPNLGESRPSFPVYYVSEKPASPMPSAEDAPRAVTLMLAGPPSPHAQMAVIIPRDRDGKVVLGAIDATMVIEGVTWESRIVFSVARSFSVLIVERSR